MRQSIVIWIILFFSVNIFSQNEKQLVILHVNDTHSHIDPISANAPANANEGGEARIAAYIESVRAKNPSALVLHAGDFVQGTFYFNMFKGEVEIALMNQMKFDAACLGNHEFDYGYPVLEKMIRQAKFPVIATNYDFSETPLKGLTKKYIIIKHKGLKIGIFAVGVNPEGLIAKPNYAGMKFLPPIEIANKTALFLKQKKKCDLVVCLSHLGYLETLADNDIQLAQQTRNIDIIVGGHSHTFLQQPDKRLNLDRKEVVINQMGKYGIYVGRLDVTFKKEE